MKNIRIINIGKYYPPYFGGTENHLFTLVQELKTEARMRVLVSNTRFKTSIENDNGIYIFRLASLGRIFSLPLSLSMPFWLKALKAEILHFHLPNPLSVISYFLSRPKGKIVVSYHSDIVRQKFFTPLFNFFLIKFLKKASRIIVTSENLIKNSYILTKFRDKCKVIPHGIDVGRFNPDERIIQKSAEIRHRYGSPLVLFVGRLVYYKGLEYLLRAMKDIEAKLMIVGSGPLKNRLRKLSSHYGVRDKVIWMGEVENEKIISYYYACDVFVLPSSSQAESFGIVQLEASVCRKPVISTDLATGVPFVNLNNKTGLVVPARNPQALACAVNRLLKSPELCKLYGQNGRERVEKEFNKEKMAQETLKIYEEIL